MKRVLKTGIALCLMLCVIFMHRPLQADAAVTTWKITWDKNSQAWYSSTDGGKSWYGLNPALPGMQDGSILVIDGDNCSKGTLRLELSAKIGELCVMGGATASVKTTKGAGLAYAIEGGNTLILEGDADAINVNHDSVIQVLGNVGKVKFVYDNANSKLRFGVTGTVNEANVHIGNVWNNTNIYSVAAGKLSLTDQNILNTASQYYSLVPTAQSSQPVTYVITSSTYVPVYRLYNPATGEHFFTGNASEINGLVQAGWNDEGVAFNVPAQSNTPVYRYFSTKTGEHYYTASDAEKATLTANGFVYEGIAWYGADSTCNMVYRMRVTSKNKSYTHYTASTVERDNLINAGWTSEVTGFYAK